MNPSAREDVPDSRPTRNTNRANVGAGRAGMDSYPSTADDWLEFSKALWRCSLVMKQIGMRDVNGKLMHARFADLSAQASSEYSAQRRGDAR